MTPRGLKGNTGEPATNEDVTEAPVAPGIVLTPRISVAAVESRVVISTEANKEITIVEELSAAGTGVATGKAKLTESQRMIKEIDATVLLQQELMKSDPLLASASSFLSVVCGNERTNKNETKTNDENVRMTGTVLCVPLPTNRPQPSARYIEKQRVIRITAAESLLNEELAKNNPLLTSTAAFRKAAYGDESHKKTGQDRKQIVTTKTPLAAVVDSVTGPTRISTSQTSALILSEVSLGDEANMDMCTGNEVVLSDEEEMSLGESGKEEEGVSDGFSRSDGGSSYCESVTSRGSRKRQADGSPEREPAETTRKEFPRMTTCSEGGCRIYVPSAMIGTTTETGAQGVESTTEVGAQGVESTTETGAQGIESTMETGAQGVESTTESGATSVVFTAETVAQIVTPATETLAQSVGPTKEMVGRSEEPMVISPMTTETADAVLTTEVLVAAV